MRFSLILGIVLSLLLSAQLPCSAAPQTAEAENLTRQATFIFRATVAKLHATTMAAVPATDFTAVVRVDEVIEGPGAPPDIVGKEITVQLRDPGSLKSGQQALFFTRGWLMGKSMAVVEVGHLPQAESEGTVRDQVKATRQKMADEELQKEMLTAEAIVTGRVVSVRPAKIRHLGSEHDPDWYEAEIAVESVESGKLSAHTITLLFPRSNDVMWHKAPKFKEGERGIWLLHRNQSRLPGTEDRYTALKTLDFRPLEELERVKRLLRTQD